MMAHTDKTDIAFIVQRRLVVPGIQTVADVQTVHTLLEGLNGMQRTDIDIKKCQVKVTYDASQLGFADIEAALVAAGYAPAYNWWTRFKAAGYRYQDENDRINATSKSGACCSNPADIYAKRNKWHRNI